MRLADFTETRSEPIVSEWVAFAATCGPSGRAIELAESTGQCTEDLDGSQDMFVAILGHDLRSPLKAIIMASQLMVEAEGE